LVRAIDGLGGFTRSSATNSGIVWKVVGAVPRVSIKDTLGNISRIDSTDIGAGTNLSTLGRITLAEKYDGNWKLYLNNKVLPLNKSSIGEPIFEANETGNLYLEHAGTKRRALISIQGIILLTVLVLALPAGRRRKEMVEL